MLAKVCNSFKKGFQHKCFPVKFSWEKLLPLLLNSFSGYFWGITRVFREVQNKNWCDCQQKIPYSATKKYLLSQKFRSSQRRCSVKGPATLLERGSSIAKFLRTSILKNICEQLLLKIRISVTNSEAVLQRCSVKKGALRHFAKLTGKYLCQNLFLIKLQAWDSGAGVFLWILWKFLERLF